MQIGFNNDVDYRGKTFHIQTEDRGLASGKIETQVFHAGAILDTAIIPYGNQIEGLEGDDAVNKVRDMMKAAHKNFYKKLHSGEYDSMVGLEPVAVEEVDVDLESFDPGQDRVPASALEMERNPEAFAIDPEMGEAVDLSSLKDKLGGEEPVLQEQSAPTMMVSPSEIQSAMEADAKAAESAPKLPAKPQPQLVLLPKTGVTAWRGCEPPKEDLSIADLAEAFAG